jgi:hypothetical protein
MKRAKTAANLIAVGVLSVCLVPSARAQAQPAEGTASKSAVPGKKAGKSGKPAQGAMKAAAPTPTAKPSHGTLRTSEPKAGKVPAKTKEPKTAKPEKAAKPTESAAKGEAPASHRDPFEPLVGKKTEGNGMPTNLPPGKAGLLIATTTVDGLVRSPNGMIAVVSNPQKRVYFIREGDRLYDGQVEKIGLDGVVFRQVSKDAFGKPVDHVVTKRIYPSAGEQQ